MIAVDAILRLAIGAVLILLSDFLIMLFLAVAHQTNHVVPAFGFWTVFFLTAIPSSYSYLRRVSDSLWE